MRRSVCCVVILILTHLNVVTSFNIQKTFLSLFSSLLPYKTPLPNKLKDSCRKDETNKVKYILIPPPNPDGDLHPGNALDLTISDLLIRTRALLGEKVIPLFGSDSGGSKLRTKVQLLKKESDKNEGVPLPSIDELDQHADDVRKKQIKTMHDLSFVWADKYMKDDKPDLDGLLTTCDKEMGAMANSVFNKLLKKDKIYKTEIPCSYYMKDDVLYPLHQNISSNTLQKTTKYTLELPIESSESGQKSLSIDIFEPEMLFGYAAILFADDSKLPAKSVRLPLVDREVPLVNGFIKDSLEPFWIKGLIPNHRLTHYYFAKKMSIPGISIIDKNRRMINVPSWLYGLDRFYARQLIAERLMNKGFLKVSEPASRYVGLDLNGEEATFLMTPQWMFRSKEGDDWPVTRSCYYGHTPNGTDSKERVFDVWFVSSLWPLYIYNRIAQDNSEQQPKIDYLCCGKDISEKWVSRIRELSELITGKDILSNVHFHKLFEIMRTGPFDTEHMKMNKSDPETINIDELIKKYGKDPTRLYLSSFADGEDTNIIFKPMKISEFRRKYNRLCIKAINIAKYYKPHLSTSRNIECKLTKLFDKATDELFHMLIKNSESWDFASTFLKLKFLIIAFSNALVSFEKNPIQTAQLILKISKILSVYAPSTSLTVNKLLDEHNITPGAFNEEYTEGCLNAIGIIVKIRSFIQNLVLNNNTKYTCKLTINNKMYNILKDVEEELSEMIKSFGHRKNINISEVEIKPSEDVERFKIILI